MWKRVSKLCVNLIHCQKAECVFKTYWSTCIPTLGRTFRSRPLGFTMVLVYSMMSSNCKFDSNFRSAENIPESSNTLAAMMRKESSLSLQIPGAGGISPSQSVAGNKKVTFSQVVDQVSRDSLSSLDDSNFVEGILVLLRKNQTRGESRFV